MSKESAARKSDPNALWLEWTALDELVRWPGNPKLHDTKAIKESIRRFGFVEVVARDEVSGRVVAGHGRIEALEQMKAEGSAAPTRIRILPDGRWAVPVLRGASFESEAEAQAYLVASNRLSELGGWDDGNLARMLQSIREADSALLGVSGYKESDLKRLLAMLAQRSEDEDDLPEQVESRMQTGELWELGAHRLICGDATDRAVVGALLGAETPLLMVTDPPYGVKYDPAWRDEAAKAGKLWYRPTRTKKVSNDDRDSWRDVWELSPGAVAYVWHGALHAHVVHADLVASGYLQRAEIVWRKQMAPVSRGHYHWQHEPCWFGVRKGKTAAWIGDRKQTTVWDIVTKSGYLKGKEDKNTVHGTQKPVECMARPLRNHDGDVFDPFIGSGTTLIAAEQLGRRCFAVDIDPECCDMVVARWERLTGQKAKRLA